MGDPLYSQEFEKMQKKEQRKNFNSVEVQEATSLHLTRDVIILRQNVLIPVIVILKLCKNKTCQILDKESFMYKIVKHVRNYTVVFSNFQIS